MTTHRTRTARLAGLAAAAVLVLSACSDAADTEVELPDVPETVAPGDVVEPEGGEGGGE